MYKSLLSLYLIIFFCYILFSRVPDYFDGEFIPGVVVQKPSLEKSVQYPVGKEVFTVPIKGWGASQVAQGDTVRVIYNPDDPKQANLYTFFSYWCTLPELVISSIAFALLFFAAVFITGKEDPDSPAENKPRKRKYND